MAPCPLPWAHRLVSHLPIRAPCRSRTVAHGAAHGGTHGACSVATPCVLRMPPPCLGTCAPLVIAPVRPGTLPAATPAAGQAHAARTAVTSAAGRNWACRNDAAPASSGVRGAPPPGPGGSAAAPLDWHLTRRGRGGRLRACGAGGACRPLAAVWRGLPARAAAAARAQQGSALRAGNGARPFRFRVRINLIFMLFVLASILITPRPGRTVSKIAE